MKNKIKRFSAEKARHSADTTTKLINTMYRRIEYVAAQGETKLDWDIYAISDVLLDNLVSELVDAGYSVKLNTTTEDDGKLVAESILISW